MKRKADDSFGTQEKADDKNDGVIKAVVSENNGEISCSVEETNRIRALLGLKPLVINKPNEELKAVQNFHSQKDKQQK